METTLPLEYQLSHDVMNLAFRIKDYREATNDNAKEVALGKIKNKLAVMTEKVNSKSNAKLKMDLEHDLTYYLLELGSLTNKHLETSNDRTKKVLLGKIKNKLAEMTEIVNNFSK